MPSMLIANIVTTKERLTEHFIQQMNVATLDVMSNGSAVGYINYYNSKLGIIKYQEDYYKLDLQLPKSDHISRPWWTAYMIIKSQLTRHLYYVQ